MNERMGRSQEAKNKIKMKRTIKNRRRDGKWKEKKNRRMERMGEYRMS